MKEMIIKHTPTMWMNESNRKLHFWYAVPIGAVFSILCVLGVASGMEFKDRQYNNTWDWLDWTATMLGGLLGQVIQCVIVFLILKFT